MNAFITPQNIYHGKDSINQLNSIIEELQVSKVYVLTDPILEELEVINPILKILDGQNVKYQVSTNVVPEPPVNVGNEVLEDVKAYDPDLVLGIGGGSALDLAKASAVLAGHEGTVENYLNLSGDKKLESKGIPSVLIPTTAGTGAEITDIAVFSLEDTKDVITHKYLLADYAIVDPVLTYTLPPKVTAASGVDALTHAIEAYTSVNATPITDALALDAMKRILGNLREAVWNKKAYDARNEMSLGSLIAGLSFYNAGVAGVHGMAYPLGGLFKIPHGESNAVLLPYVYHYIWPSCLNKMATLAEVFNVSTEGKTDRQIVQEIVQGLYDLVVDVGLPTSISEYDITESDIEKLTQNAVKQTRLLARSPMPLGENEIREIFEHAYRGWE
ncbi:iron-containing alcohol dehydrogenase [Filobacillus milosensis]|uniref:Iron-containing alcohol dehydrogenase n=1 Tax=Filobacillus milosensis TaxID=94137 RepID=A0A4Y8IGG5_9BACI|nr:iron-containing alcohol dehydrogenase [Filobacillus milosensis]TFB14204.1 iron-containing alcohol dehydrogenase [Filobacillus milosensis]